MDRRQGNGTPTKPTAPANLGNFSSILTNIDGKQTIADDLNGYIGGLFTWSNILLASVF